MENQESILWTETTGRERVRMVVEMLSEPATVTAIADSAEVAWGTADSELERMEAENWVLEGEANGNTVYKPNPVKLFIDEVLSLIQEHSRDELEEQLLNYQTRYEDIHDEFGTTTLSELRRQLSDDGRSADEIREIRNAASTLEALNTELDLIRHALQLYDDISELSDDNSSQEMVAV